MIRREIPSISRYRDRALGAHARSHRSILDTPRAPSPRGVDPMATRRAVREIAAEVARAIGRPASMPPSTEPRHADDAGADTTPGPSTRRAAAGRDPGRNRTCGASAADAPTGPASGHGPAAGPQGVESGEAPGESGPAAGPAAGPDQERIPVSEEQIRERAYQLYLARGGAPGDPVQDWLRAERELLDEHTRARHP